jgi:glycosyltransferase involved in cell wall biosynthesis
MKILVVAPYPPVPQISGGAIRVYHMLRNMALQHEVTLLSYGSPEDQWRVNQELGLHLEQIHMIPKPWTRKSWRLAQVGTLCADHSSVSLLARQAELQAKLDRLLTENDFDIVQAEFSMMGIPHVHSSALKILDTHEVEYDIYRRMWLSAQSPLRRFYYHQEYKKIFREEIDTCRRQDAILVTSVRDKELLDADVPRVPKFLIPNGVDTSYFTPSKEQPDWASMVFTGTMAYYPNCDAMLYFLDEIFPLIEKEIPEAKIYIVGNRPPKRLARRASEKVVVTSFVSDVRPFVSRASVFVVPLRAGGGTRLKILEAMAMRRPVVTTSIGCEGLDVTDGESLLIADEPPEFSQAVVTLLRDVALQQRLVRNAYELVLSRYEWSVIGQQLEEAYRSLVSEVRS